MKRSPDADLPAAYALKIYLAADVIRETVRIKTGAKTGNVRSIKKWRTVMSVKRSAGKVYWVRSNRTVLQSLPEDMVRNIF